MNEVRAFLAVAECRQLVRAGFGLMTAARLIAEQYGIQDMTWLLDRTASAELDCAITRAERATNKHEGIQHDAAD